MPLFQTEGNHAGAFIVKELDPNRSRENITVAVGQVLSAGAVIATLLTGTATASADAGNTGDGAMGAITISSEAVIGNHVLTINEPGANVGAFTVENPDGVIIGSGDVASLFTKGGLSFTLADGATDFVAGDIITITVVATDIKTVEFNAQGTDGSQNVSGVLFDNIDATSGDLTAVAVVRGCTINEAELVWKTGATADDMANGVAQLNALGAIVR